MTAHIAKVKADYNKVAALYSQYEDLPTARLEIAGVRAALGDCDGLCILDLGGGTGIHARTAIDAGASRVDVVDISEGMLRVGQSKHHFPDHIFWHVGDGTRPLEAQGLGILPPGSYDIVMGNWVMDSAGTDDGLRGLWRNIASYLKVDGRFVGVRQLEVGMFQPWVMAGEPKYGAASSDIVRVEGGVEHIVTLFTDPPCSFRASARDDSLRMINKIPEGVGFADLRLLKLETLDVVLENPSLWADFLESPFFGVVLGTKKDKERIKQMSC